MAIQFVESFAVDSLANIIIGNRWDAKNDGGSHLSITSSGGPFNDFYMGMNFSGGSAYLTKSSFTGNLSTVFVGFWFFLGAVNTGNDNSFILAFLDGGTAQVSVLFPTGTNVPRIARGFNSATLSNAFVGIPVGTWVFLEFGITFHGSAGTIQMKRNGVDIIPIVSSLNTAPSGNNFFQTMQLGQLNGSNNPVSNWRYSDLYVCDSTGAHNNTFLGPRQINVFRPTGNGTVQFTPLAGSNFSEVNANPTTGDSSYNSTSTTSNADLFTHAAASGLSSINGVQVNAIARVDAGGSHTSQGILFDGSTTVATSAVGLGASYAWVEGIQETEVTGGAFPITNSDITNYQFGYKLTS